MLDELLDLEQDGLPCGTGLLIWLAIGERYGVQIESTASSANAGTEEDEST
jgi:hypothetical protein